MLLSLSSKVEHPSKYGVSFNSGHAGKRVHKLDLDVRKRIDELDLKVWERIDELPFPDFIREGIDYLHLQVREGIDDLHSDVGERIDDLDLSREPDALVVAVGIDLRCGGRRRDGQCENQADQQADYLFHGDTPFMLDCHQAVHHRFTRTQHNSCPQGNS